MALKSDMLQGFMEEDMQANSDFLLATEKAKLRQRLGTGRLREIEQALKMADAQEKQKRRSMAEQGKKNKQAGATAAAQQQSVPEPQGLDGTQSLRSPSSIGLDMGGLGGAAGGAISERVNGGKVVQQNNLPTEGPDGTPIAAGDTQPAVVTTSTTEQEQTIPGTTRPFEGAGNAGNLLASGLNLIWGFAGGPAALDRKTTVTTKRTELNEAVMADLVSGMATAQLDAIQHPSKESANRLFNTHMTARELTGEYFILAKGQTQAAVARYRFRQNNDNNELGRAALLDGRRTGEDPGLLFKYSQAIRTGDFKKEDEAATALAKNSNELKIKRDRQADAQYELGQKTGRAQLEGLKIQNRVSAVQAQQIIADHMTSPFSSVPGVPHMGQDMTGAEISGRPGPWDGEEPYRDENGNLTRRGVLEEEVYVGQALRQTGDLRVPNSVSIPGGGFWGLGKTTGNKYHVIGGSDLKRMLMSNERNPYHAGTLPTEDQIDHLLMMEEMGLVELRRRPDKKIEIIMPDGVENTADPELIGNSHPIRNVLKPLWKYTGAFTVPASDLLEHPLVSPATKTSPLTTDDFEVYTERGKMARREFENPTKPDLSGAEKLGQAFGAKLKQMEQNDAQRRAAAGAPLRSQISGAADTAVTAGKDFLAGAQQGREPDVLRPPGQ